MGFIKDIFFKKKEETKQDTKLETQLKENIKAGADYSKVLEPQKIVCTACGMVIEGTPRIKKHQGKTFYLHKRCLKRMMKGELHKAIPNPVPDQNLA